MMLCEVCEKPATNMGDDDHTFWCDEHGDSETIDLPFPGASVATDSRLAKEYRYQREHGGTIVGESARQAIRAARARLWAEDHEVDFVWEEESEPWDADVPEPPVHLCLTVETFIDGKKYIAHLGSIGLLSWGDPYMRVCEADLAIELYEEWRKDEDDRQEKARAARHVAFSPESPVAEGW